MAPALERLLREALYCVARSRPESETVRAVQEAFRLAESLPGEEPAQDESEDTAAAAGGQALAGMAATAVGVALVVRK